MTNSENQPSPPSIRQLIEDALTEEQLNDLCFDDFRYIYNQTEGQNRGDRIRLLVEYAEKQGKTPQLLKAIERINPNVYAEYAQNLAEYHQALTSPYHQVTGNSSPPKVFISYTHDDRELIDRVFTLSERLRFDGVDCDIDQYQSPETDLQQWMEARLEWADFVVIVCTKEYRCFQEQEAYVSGITWKGSVVIDRLYEVTDRDLKFIPIIVKAEDKQYIPEPLLEVTSYNLELDENYEHFYRYLTAQPLPDNPELHKLRAIQRHNRQQTFLPAKIYSNIPERGRCHFVGRQGAIEQLLQQISPNRRQIKHNIHGIGGIGKTSLAIEVAHRCLKARMDNTSSPDVPLFDAFIFISFKDGSYPIFNTFVPPTDIAKTPLDIYRIIAKTLEEARIVKLPEEEQVQASYQALSKQSTLLVVDNTETLSREDNQKVLDFLDRVPPSTKVIIATKDPLSGMPSAIRLESLGKQDVTDIIQEESELRGIKTTTDEITTIYNRVGGHALVVKDVLNEINKGSNLEHIFDPETSSVETLIKQCIDQQVRSLGDLAFQIFMAVVMLDNLPIQDLLLKVAGYTNINQKVSDANRALLELERLCLIVKQENNCYSVEPTTREYARSNFLFALNPAILSGMEERQLEYYRELTEQHGGEDWGKWKSQYTVLKQEWQHIESVLEKYRDRGDWTNLFKMWEKVDRYVDLNGYWQERLKWWSIIEQNTDNPRIKAKALAEKGWSKILIGNANTDYIIAREWLRVAQDNYKFDGDYLIKADIANYSAIAWETENKDTCRYWLQRESEIIENSDLGIEDRIRNRYRARNLYFRARIEDDSNLAEQQFRAVIELCDRINWLRFRNYAQNDLADILVDGGELEEAEELLEKGLDFAKDMEEERRIALYYFSHAKLFRKKIQTYEHESQTDLRNSEYRTNLRSSINEAKTRFEKLGMLPELREIEEFDRKVS